MLENVADPSSAINNERSSSTTEDFDSFVEGGTRLSGKVQGIFISALR